MKEETALVQEDDFSGGWFEQEEVFDERAVMLLAVDMDMVDCLNGAIGFVKESDGSREPFVLYVVKVWARVA